MTNTWPQKMLACGIRKLLWWACVVFGSVAFTSASAPKFDWRLANISVELSTLAYCNDPRAALSSFPERLEGFTISSLMMGTKGFIGSLPSERAIYVVYAGTGTLLDWVVDADANLVDYGGCDKCKVHQGFRIVEQMGFPKVLSSVGLLKLLHPSYKVVVTGHSKGAAEATIAALDLVKAGISDVSLLNFGSPRVGNSHFAEYASSKLKVRYRVTHHTDTVPSVPRRREGYEHISGEWYEHPAMHVRPCAGYEDPTCSAQWGRRFGVEDGAPPPANTTAATGSAQQPGDASAADPAPLDSDYAREAYLAMLSAAGNSEYDHLHYLGRVMRCPAAEPDSPSLPPSNRTDADSGPGDAAGPDVSEGSGGAYFPYPFQPALGHSSGGAADNATQDSRREAARAQRKMMAFVLAASLCLMLLFALTVFYAIREGARRAVADRRRRARELNEGIDHVNRETELAPLLSADVAKETYNATANVEELA